MRLGIAVLAATVGMLFAAPLAHGFIYWSSYEGANSKIGRADLDGGDYRPSIVSGIYYGQGVAADGSGVYWTNSGGGSGEFASAKIGRASADGSGPNPSFRDVGWSQGLFDLKATDGQIFWLKGGYMGAGGLEISRAPIGGGSRTLVGTGSEIEGFDVENGYAYWSEGEYIVRAVLTNPAAPDRTWLRVGPGLEPAAVAVEGDHVYWTEIEPSSYPGYSWEGVYGTSIGRAPIAEPTAVVHGLVKGIRVRLDSGLDVEGEYVYWANMADPLLPYPQNIPGHIGRATIGGSGVNSKFIGPLGTTSEPRRIDADDAAPVTPPPFIPGPPPRPGPPSFRIVKTENRKFRPAKASTPPRLLASISKKLPSGTVFTYELTADAAVTVEMRRLKAGRTVGKKCKPRNRANVSKKKCDLVEHKLWRSGRAGVNELPYTGKVKGKVLKPGRYKAVFTAANAGGSRSASVGFTLVR